MISLNQLSITFGQKLLFYDVNLILNTGQSYALIGANGCGKSTLFRLITQEEEPSSGEIIIPKDASIGWLKQDQFRYENTAIQDIVLDAKPALAAAIAEKNVLMNSETWTDAQGLHFAELEELIYQQDGYTAPIQIEKILLGLGIPKAYHQEPLKALSGGYKLRVLLAQALFQNPSILLLDEPTNHLDIESIRWLEQYLITEFKGLLLFISHDREFIDHLADHILDVDYGEIRQYSGRYDKFLSEKQLIEEQKTTERRSVEDKLAHMQSFVDRFKAKASKAAQARSRLKMMDKIELPDVQKSSRLAPVFQISPKRPSAKLVAKVDNLAKSYDDKLLFNDFHFNLHRQDKCAIVGANGRGKSTLLKILLGTVSSDSGSVEWGQETSISYFSQDHHEFLNESKTVFQWLSDTVSEVSEQQIRKTLGQMLFIKDDVHKNILNLSGGESARLLMAKVILEAPNVLILDEPTNHMDLETIEALGKALKQYTGTLLVVSHNRHFIESFATRIFYFPPKGKIKDYSGGYKAFLEAFNQNFVSS